MEEQINIRTLAVLVAVAATFFLGFLWYTPLFGKVWAREMGFDVSNMKVTAGQMAKGLIINVIGNLFFVWVFAHNIAAWSFVPGAREMSTVSSLASSVVFTWLGFFLPVDLNGLAWEQKSFKLFAINTSYHFMMVLVAAVILYFMA